ncbi:BA14K family protein [Corticibacterium sp. UT-5YL-CI-8]|nr:BA14K family protein [Tianweitania sp. UT-5YL-CI-8]
MKKFMIIVSALGLAVAMLVTGAVSATIFFRAEPEQKLALKSDALNVWTDKPAVVDAATQNFERVPPRPAFQTLASSTEMSNEESGAVEVSATAREEAVMRQDYENATTIAHQEWCAKRFRSYQISTNSYTSHRGVKRECKSPYGDGSSEPTQNEEVVDVVEASFQPETAFGGGLNLMNSDHVQSCFNRYRSYRPEDNTYQPYSGGPRRQCN